MEPLGPRPSGTSTRPETLHRAGRHNLSDSLASSSASSSGPVSTAQLPPRPATIPQVPDMSPGKRKRPRGSVTIDFAVTWRTTPPPSSTHCINATAIPSAAVSPSSSTTTPPSRGPSGTRSCARRTVRARVSPGSSGITCCMIGWKPGASIQSESSSAAMLVKIPSFGGASETPRIRMRLFLSASSRKPSDSWYRLRGRSPRRRGPRASGRRGRGARRAPRRRSAPGLRPSPARSAGRRS